MASSESITKAGTAERALDVAERLVQARGFNGFSYADVAGELQITKASLHYHFPNKAALGRALIDRYAARFNEALTAIARDGGDALSQLGAYASLYSGVMEGELMCLCGILAAEYETLPDPMREAVTQFFEDNEVWLDDVLARGQTDGSLQFDGPVRETAQMVLGALEGAMLVARAHGGLEQFQASAGRLLGALSR
jgi:TetR/AcrR family transcriptional regulator, transcriptional repressor for nem operon